jgi:glyoxylase-like metal-dependent hydrolase (beta-lactamase superfamily II)
MDKMPLFQGEEKTKFLPHKTYKDKMSLLGGNEKIELYYFGRGHTNGDTIIVFPALRVAHTGDLFAAKGTPLIDVNNGGSGIEYPKTLKKAAQGIKGVDTVIPGHNPVTDWNAFAEFGAFNQDFLTAVQQAFKEGKTADEAAAALKLPDKYKDYATKNLKDNVTKIYAELKQ